MKTKYETQDHLARNFSQDKIHALRILEKKTAQRLSSDDTKVDLNHHVDIGRCLCNNCECIREN